MTALNPVKRIGKQIGDAIRIHHPELSKTEVRDRVVELLRLVEVPNPRARMDAYPHQLSGGMRQRVMIAIANANRPQLLIADEPTTALDVTVQAQVLQVMERVRRESESSMILITHDLGLVAEVADRVVVLYGGKVMESAEVEPLFVEPLHPYTKGLLESILQTGGPAGLAYAIPGQPPRLEDRPPGCVFQPRCSLGRDEPLCASVAPAVDEKSAGHAAACHFSSRVPTELEVGVGFGARDGSS
jgi:oligopeptide/dipeptide ABC transporter ATP-binding protein